MNEETSLVLAGRGELATAAGVANSLVARGLRDIAKKRFLEISVHEENQLFRRLAMGDLESYDKIVRTHMNLVERIAQSHLGYGIDLEDLTELGISGLLRAVEVFDSRQDQRFGTFAQPWIKHPMKWALGELDWFDWNSGEPAEDI